MSSSLLLRLPSAQSSAAAAESGDPAAAAWPSTPPSTPPSSSSLSSPPSAPPGVARESLTSFDDFLSGITAGSLSTLLLHPFDLIKTRMQMQHTRGPAAAVTPSVVAPLSLPSSLSTARALVLAEGWRALWKGLTPNLVGNTAAWGAYFFLYNHAKERLQQWRGRELRAGDFLACASVTGAAVQAVTNPLWVVKTRSFLDLAPHGAGGRRPSMAAALAALWREEGVRGLYRGFVPGLLGVSHGAVQFTTYDSVKRRWAAAKRRRSPPPPSTSSSSSHPPFTAWETVSMAVLSKTVASVSTYPYQVLRTHLQSRDVQPPYASTWDCARRLWAAGGLRAFYRGVVISTVKVIPNACAVFVIYERMQHWLHTLARASSKG